MRTLRRRLPTSPLAALAAALLVAGCGGGGGDDPPATWVSGEVVKGPVAGARVCAYKAVASGKGDQLACTNAGPTGSYSLGIQYAGDVVIEAMGGTYTDEVTGATRMLEAPMQVVLASQGGTVVGMITPLTSIAYSVAQASGVTSTTFSAAASYVAGQFNLGDIDIVTTVPVVSGAAINAYGRVLRGVSQYLADGGFLVNFQAFDSLSLTYLSGAFTTAFNKANQASASFNFTPPPAPAPGPAPSPSPSPAPSPAPAPAPAGGTLVLTVEAMGTTSVTTLGNMPQPASQAEFCSGIESGTVFQQVAQQGGTPAIDSCSYAGGVGNVSATVSFTSPVATTVPYTVKYEWK